MAESIFASARILSNSDNVSKYELSDFSKKLKQEDKKLEDNIDDFEEIKELKEDIKTKEIVVPPTPIIDNSEVLNKIEPIFSEFSSLAIKMEQISQKILSIEGDIVSKNKELDSQVVKAIKDLQQSAEFFEKTVNQVENKMLKTAIGIAKKIIAIELGENSTKIAKQTIKQLLEKVKNATKVKIHLNPKDYVILKKELELENHIELIEDINVVAGGVVIASNIGNYDGNIEAKISTMLESLDLII
ncbi:FliH/SctL family protein [Aliarcobacter thereius]|uniref:Flagellar assembly protein FliH n=1 Tax=Aliarcobacter thereius LMG 24486 TaxID=1032240 RepID=A0A1C7WLQ3_9BACT|nr:FliH/SctL family protein [Aliarcobacter thereius]OCL92224.1 flagellar assembly protein H [Aliarcobacter thereius]OCL94680.1 flagellar assembly protein H [Aliarcobacter thereius LMG 24486]QBF15444.1 flagellar export apparatus, cytoplasmic ATPase complex, FliH component [Aliarcobacter thereius LMG 24486]TLS93260.1 flagellar assembly protein FliH [Aliarcobacter thereius]TLT08022.1 flagellar assembly protein FliH [Aliarcobacter thereius]